MAGDLSCAAKRRAKERSSEYINCRIDKNDQSSIKTTTRNGLRVYKIVILGDGGVGKSGKCYNATIFMFVYLCGNSYIYSHI